MTAQKKKPEVRGAPLTAQQVDKLNVYSARVDDAKKRLDEYLSATLDAAGIEGTWDVLGIEDDPPVLKLRKQNA